MRADIHCKGIPFSWQGEHFITAIFWIPDGSPLQVRLRVVWNLIAIIFILITVRREVLANHFVTLKISRTLDKKENQSVDDLLDYIDKNLGRFNEGLAGDMLTGNRSSFLETDDSIAWLYHCPIAHSSLHTMNQCYDRILIVYESEIQFVDPKTRQTHPVANLQNSTDRIKNLFQFDMDQEDLLYTLTAGIVHQDRPGVFGTKDVSPVYSFFCWISRCWNVN